MTTWEIRGWCPGALRPMQSGDGLVVRIRPPSGRLTPQQAQAIAQAANAHGNGIIDLSARANLQLRGVTEISHPRLIDDLHAQGLIDPDIETESLRNLIVTPFRGSPATGHSTPPTLSLRQKGQNQAPSPSVALDDGTRHLSSPSWEGEGEGGYSADDVDALAATLTAAFARMPRFPGKFGFVLDPGPRPVLAQASADIRIERAEDGRLILRPDGFPLGQPVTDLALDAIVMAQWFVQSGGVTDGRGRMAALIAKGIIPSGCTLAPAPPLPTPTPGLRPDGALVALALGQMRSETFSALAALGHEIRPTPWRMLFLVGATALPAIQDLITDASDPILRITACTGAPACPQGLGDTRTLARRLAPHLAASQTLHLSGCPKGCAHPSPADLTFTATARGYDLIRNGIAQDKPCRRGLTPQAMEDYLKALDAPSL
jgi:precorrin-3B synthase